MDYGHFYLRTGVDEASDRDGPPLVDAALAGQGIAQSGPTVVIVSPKDFALDMPLAVRVWDAEPDDQTSAWPDAFQVSVVVAEAGLRYDSCTMGGAEIPVPPGTYRARILGTGLPGDDDAPVGWLLQMWPATIFTKPVRLHPVDAMRTDPRQMAGADELAGPATPTTQVPLPVQLKINSAYRLTWSGITYKPHHTVATVHAQWQMTTNPGRYVLLHVTHDCDQLPEDAAPGREETHAGMSMHARRLAGGGHALRFIFDHQLVSIEAPTGKAVGTWADQLLLQPVSIAAYRSIARVPDGYRATSVSRSSGSSPAFEQWEIESIHPDAAQRNTIGVGLYTSDETWQSLDVDPSTLRRIHDEVTDAVAGDFYQDTVSTHRFVRTLGTAIAAATCFDPEVSAEAPSGLRRAAIEALAALELG